MEKINEKVESSMSVQGRVSLIDLAKIDEYFFTKGYIMRSMSQLLNWTAGQLVLIMERNGHKSRIRGIGDAIDYLEERGIYGGKLKERDKRRLGIVRGLESMRIEGHDIENEMPGIFNTIHNKRSVEPFNEDLGINQDDMTRFVSSRVKAIRKELGKEKEKDND